MTYRLMTYRWMTYRWMIVLGMMVALPACAYMPHDGGQLSSGDKTQFIGFSTAQSGQVQIQAQQPSNGQWVTIATTTASRGGVPAAVRCAAAAVTSARMPVASSFPLRSRVIAPVRPGRRR